MFERIGFGYWLLDASRLCPDDGGAMATEMARESARESETKIDVDLLKIARHFSGGIEVGK